MHAHVIVPEVEHLVAGEPGLQAQRDLDLVRNGAESAAVSGRMVAERMTRLTEVEVRLSDMDGAGIDVQVLSPSPSQYHYWAGPELAEAVVRAANRGVAAVVAEEPARFTGLGLVPLQHPELAVDALDDALELGLVGVEISSHAPRPGGGTVELSDPRLDPLWARAEQRGAVIFLHPFGCTLDARLDRFYLANTVGQPVENAVALSHLIFAGVLDRHPGLRVVAAHGGGYLPGHIGRSDHAWRARPDARRCAEPPSSYLRRIWFDSLVHDAVSLRALVDAAGADRVLLGSDHPFDMGAPDPVELLAASGLPADVQRMIRSVNARELGLAPAQRGTREESP
ncbi:amidohydrolase family protein [Saccharopolyspora hirsuta]|uniref:amidohydrolase family protein n=1 Tax=Saccharopolyspora hirsuta TaxID=1837 RepID=UPI00331BF1D8